MQRQLSQLSAQTFDLIVVGGGIHGACVARDAALRGLSVALLERGDFGQGASANSLKILHGGLRYVQDGSLTRIRTMVAERATWLRLAPHLVDLLPCLLPTYAQLRRSRPALWAAFAVTELMARGRSPRFPRSQILSRAECLERLPGLPSQNVTGGALWYDGQIYNSERLLLAVLHAAAEAGAVLANHAPVTGLLQDERAVHGVTATDSLTGQPLEVRGRLVLLCAGAWTDALLRSFGVNSPAPRFRPSLAVNLVTRQILPDYAVGLTARLGGSRGREQILFVVPWRGFSLIGTAHQPGSNDADPPRVPEGLIQDLLNAVNQAYPPAGLRRAEVVQVQAGYLPAAPSAGPASRVKLVREGQLHDHLKEDHLAGLITLVGVKYTTARKVAEAAVDLAVARLGRRVRPCQTERQPLYGGDMEHVDDCLAQVLAARPAALSPETLTHLVRSYGTQYRQVLEYLKADPAWGQPVCAQSPVIRAEILHAIRAELACTLEDVVLRRTELGLAGRIEPAALEVCARLMATELNWPPARLSQEMDRLQAGGHALEKTEPPQLLFAGVN